MGVRTWGPIPLAWVRQPLCLSVLVPRGCLPAGRVCLCHTRAGGRGLPSARAQLPQCSWNSYACHCVKFEFSFLSSSGFLSPPCASQPGMQFPRLGSSTGSLAGPPGLHEGYGNPFGREEPRTELAANPGPCAGPIGFLLLPACWGFLAFSGAICSHARVSATAALNRETWSGSTDPGIGVFPSVTCTHQLAHMLAQQAL